MIELDIGYILKHLGIDINKFLEEEEKYEAAQVQLFGLQDQPNILHNV
ncbi:hypothetical protein [Paenibacillus alba]|uniref:Uncharacterized protein n=1 Tax=Paenibacillus alba TaxID=1197127 RepID=A0ABU6GAD8_9BACL|nr:hypothetical protein [Paenibacillus alba]MEC0231154.1 hypothetical protein [Paenibacillus alba]